MIYIYNSKTNQYYEQKDSVEWINHKKYNGKYIEVDRITYAIGKYFMISPDKVVDKVVDVLNRVMR